MVVSPEKSSVQLYTRKRGQNFVIKIKNRVLECNRLLGVTFDAPLLTYGPHISELSKDVKRRLDIMKCLSSTNWGAAQKVLTIFYKAYVRGT